MTQRSKIGRIWPKSEFECKEWIFLFSFNEWLRMDLTIV